MYFKQLFYICVIVTNFVDVKSDCDDFVKCFGDFVHKFFGNDEGNITKIDIIDISDYNNNDTVIQEGLNIGFNLTKLENNLSDIIANITIKLKEEIEEKANKSVSVSDTFVNNNNNSDIFVNFLNIDNVFVPKADKHISLENSVLKVKPQVQLANNASVMFNKKRKTNTTNNYKTTTFNSFINKTQGERIVNNDSKKIVQNGTSIQVNTEKRNKNHDYFINDTITVKPITINKQKVDLEYESKIFVKHVDIDTTTSKNAYLPIVSTTDNGRRKSNNHDLPATSKKAYFPIRTTTEIGNHRKSNNNLATTSKSNTNLATQRPIANSKSTSGNVYLLRVHTTTIEYTPPTTVKSIDVLSTIKQEGFDIFNINVNKIFEEQYSSYEIQDDNITDYPIIDYIDLYKDTTNEVVNYKTTENYEEINKKSEGNDLDNNIIDYSNAMRNKNNGLHVSFSDFCYKIFAFVYI